MPTFIDGTRVVLADGQSWALPVYELDQIDAEYEATLKAIGEAEDGPERLRFELALTILLLSRNYQFGPSDFQDLLDFEPGDPAKAELQGAVHNLVVEQVRRLQLAASRPRIERDTRSPSWNMVGRLRARWSLRHN
jgi:hypothetical protein